MYVFFSPRFLNEELSSSGRSKSCAILLLVALATRMLSCASCSCPTGPLSCASSLSSRAAGPCHSPTVHSPLAYCPTTLSCATCQLFHGLALWLAQLASDMGKYRVAQWCEMVLALAQDSEVEHGTAGECHVPSTTVQYSLCSYCLSNYGTFGINRFYPPQKEIKLKKWVSFFFKRNRGFHFSSSFF